MNHLPSSGDGNASTANTPARQGGLIYRMFAGARQLIRAFRDHPVWGIAFGLCVFVLAYAGNWGLDKVRDRLFGPDEFLAQIAEDQKKEFAELKDSLGKLGQSLESGDQKTFRAVESAVKAVETNNQNLIRQLVLAKEENDTLRRVTEKVAGVSGGYDFILSEKQGMRIDETTAIGINYRGRDYIVVGLSTKEGSKNHDLRPGQSIGYTSAGQVSCRIALLSLRGEPGSTSATFTNLCDKNPASAQAST
ncbi:hypothetical protein OS187_04155 [Xanthomonadaceae bacterium JHOS43]|nr:hypothetical protein [Xanthomonadaceae bacterium JHOS43]